MHVGSMGMDLSQIVQGAKQLVEFADKINAQVILLGENEPF